MEQYLSKDHQKILIVSNEYNYGKNFVMDFQMQSNNVFLTYQELIENIRNFPKIRLREEKQIIYFLQNLSNDHKKALNIDSYFDAIDIFYQYNNFLSYVYKYNLNENDVLNILDKWQRRLAKIYFEIDKKLNPNSLYYMDYEKYKLKYNNVEYLDQFSKIYCIDPFLNKYVYSEIVKYRKDVIVLSDNPLELEDLDYFSKVNKHVNFIETKNTLDSILYSLTIDTDEIYDDSINNKNNIFFEVFNDLNISLSKKYTLDEFSEYRMLEYIYDVLDTFENNLFKTETVYKLFTYKYFLNTFKVKDYTEIYNMYKNNKIYFDLSDIKSQDNKKILNDILEILDYENYNDFMNIYNEKILQEFDKSEIMYSKKQQLAECITEVASIESFSFFTSWQKIFNKPKPGKYLLKYLLKYIKYKEVLYKSSGDFVISSIEKISKNKNLVITNFKGFEEEDESFFFTNTQLEKLGISEAKEKFLNYTYKLFKVINESENIYITYVKEDEYIPSYIEYMFNTLKDYSVQTIEVEYKDYINLIYRGINFEKKEYKPLDDDYLYVKKTDYRKDKIGYYDLEKLIKSPYVYYVSSLLKKYNYNIYNEDSEPKIIGILEHELLQESITKDINSQDIFNKFLSYKKYLKNYKLSYYIYKDSIEASIKNFKQYIDKNNLKDYNIELEKIVEDDKFNLRLDALFSPKELGYSYIIDFKSNVSNTDKFRQLVLYKDILKIDNAKLLLFNINNADILEANDKDLESFENWLIEAKNKLIEYNNKKETDFYNLNKNEFIDELDKIIYSLGSK